MSDCPLTPRQLQVLGMVARGNPLKVIGERLGIKERTVENHMCDIHIRLKTYSQAHAVYLGLPEGWLK